MSHRDSLPAPREAKERDPRVRGKQDIPPLRKGPSKNVDVDGAKFYFRLTGVAEKDFYEYVQFWICLGKKFSGDDITFPVAAPLPADAYYWHDRNTGKRGGFPAQGAVAGCRLMALAQQRHPVIAVNKFRPTKKDGSPNHNLERMHVVPIQLVVPVKDAAGKLVYETNNGQPVLVNGKPVPKVDVLPNGIAFEMWQSLWEQFLDILEPIPEDPKAAAIEDDLTGGGAADGGVFKRVKPLKTVPAGVDPTTLVWSIHKAVIPPEPGKQKSSFNFRYIIDFSDKLSLDLKKVPVPAPALPVFTELFPPIKASEIQEYVDRWKEMGFSTTAAPVGTSMAPAGTSLPAGAVPPSSTGQPPAATSAPATASPVGEQPFPGGDDPF